MGLMNMYENENSCFAAVDLLHDSKFSTVQHTLNEGIVSYLAIDTVYSLGVMGFTGFDNA